MVTVKSIAYALPSDFVGKPEPAAYLHWLHSKAANLVQRDKKRGNTDAKPSEYRAAIHQAVMACGGHDHYTGEKLDWSLISKYDNVKSKEGRRAYKKEFAALPTVDHLDEGLGAPNFVICSWRTNDAKHDLDRDEFLAVCHKVLEKHGYGVQVPKK